MARAVRYVLSVIPVGGEVSSAPRRGQNRPTRRQGRRRSAELILWVVGFGLVACIGLAFLIGGLQYITGPVIRTSATVIAVHADPAYGPSKGKNGTTFTLRFTDQDHQVVTEQTQEVVQSPAVSPGDRIQVYVPADPSDVTDVRFGSPGEYDFFMAEMFFGIAVVGWTGVALARLRRKRRFAGIANSSGEAHIEGGDSRRVTATRDGLARLDEMLSDDN